MALEIRDAEAGDEAAWRRLWGDYLAFYAVDLDDAVTARTWTRILDPDARGKGIGRALIDDLIAICRANGWSRLYWHTNRDNAQARKLYESYVEDQGYMRYRIDLR